MLEKTNELKQKLKDFLKSEINDILEKEDPANYSEPEVLQRVNNKIAEACALVKIIIPKYEQELEELDKEDPKYTKTVKLINELIEKRIKEFNEILKR